MHNKTYVVNSTVEQVHTRLRMITTRRWDDHSIDVIGSIKQDGNFRLTSKQGLDAVSWMENRPAYLYGRLSSGQDRTRIQVRIRPNLLLLFLSLATLLLLLLESLNITFWPGPSRQFKLLILTAINLLLISLSFWCMNELKNKFERLMSLREAVGR
ncbi:MAG TPA: hypothetical protein VGB46_04230 [Flavisolibacter sp.]